MNQESIDRLVGLIGQAAERLGFEAVRIWPQMVAITFVQSLCWVILGPLLVVLGGIGFRWLWAERKKALDKIAAERTRNSYSTGDTMGLDLFTTFAALGFIVLTCIVVATLPYSITAMLYPEATTVLRLVGK